MSCPGCGKEISASEAHLACTCGYVPEAEAPRPSAGYYGGEIVSSLTSRFSVNQLIIFGGCLLLLVSLFLPFLSISTDGIMEGMGLGGLGVEAVTISTSGYSLIFGGEEWGLGTLGYFMDFMLPLLAVIAISLVSGISLLKLNNAKAVVLGASLLGLYLALSALLRVGTVVAGFGLIVFLVLWVIITIAAFLEYKDIQIIRF